MKIQQIFAKPIDRDIKGVIKVGQDDKINIRQELEEYVVTRELQKHFADFFASYKKSITGRTDKMGVWISGFFGSGKSHFLKILSYLIENREVDGRHAVDYFIDDGKIQDQMVLADMKLAASVPTDVILFNIDSKGESAGKQDKDAIVSVFLKVFNEMQGFDGQNPHLADLERNLSEKGKYEMFKDAFAAHYGDPWESVRSDFDFIQDDVVEVLADIGFMSEEAGRNWCEKASEPYAISIERFADLVKSYIDKKGSNHHIAFLVDEIGQYIGEDSRLMLNLQTVTENLGTACGGRAWVIVTSQQDIDSITKTKGNDFSKIQGRFDTRLSLSSANVDEVIRKRVLEKNETGRQTLSLLYDDKDTVIRNLILFNDGIEKKLFADRIDFADVYPFVPYQFNLLGDVLTSIRTHGASGKHLAEGERSMLALFKESAVRIMDQEEGALVPFNLFYDALEQFLDHSHRGVILRALDNEYLNPGKEDECFDINVLKTLFMIKYVKEIVPNLDNITSLLVNHIDNDRIALKDKVEESLKKLVRQTLVQKNAGTYVFLTDEEQEINREIEKEEVEIAEIRQKVSEMIFDGIFDVKKYRHPAFSGRYTFGFNQILDGQPYKSNQNYDISLKILTPVYDMSRDDHTLRMMSSQEHCVIASLPDDNAFLDEIRASLKIEKYLRRNTASTAARQEEIKTQKKVEMRERMDNARIYLEESLRHAELFSGGDKLQIGAKNISDRLTDALGKLVQTVYHKISYIDTPMSEAHIRTLLKGEKNSQISLSQAEQIPNRLALSDLFGYIELNAKAFAKTSLKSVTDYLKKAPYGFTEDDIQWLVAKLFKDGFDGKSIELSLNSEEVTLLNQSPDEIYRYLSRKEFLEKLMISPGVEIPEKHKKAVREVMKDLFHVSPSGEDVASVRRNFCQYAERLKAELEAREQVYQLKPAYPGGSVIRDGKALLVNAVSIKNTPEFFETIFRQQDAFLDFAEDYEPVRAFFDGEQKKIWDHALKQIEIYNDSKTFIVNKEIEGIVSRIEEILKKPAPYSSIRNLPQLLDQYITAYTEVFAEMEKPVQQVIKEARNRVFSELEGKLFAAEMTQKVMSGFDGLRDKAETCSNVAVLQNITVEADALKIRLLNEIAAKDAEFSVLQKNQESAESRSVAAEDSVGISAVKMQEAQKQIRTVSIRTVNLERTWRIETEDDVDRYLAELGSRLKQQLKEDIVLHIEF